MNMGSPVSPFQKGMISRFLDATSLRPEYARLCNSAGSSIRIRPGSADDSELHNVNSCEKMRLARVPGI
jgi:hypothetical protein